MKSTKSAASLQRVLCNLELMKAGQLAKRYVEVFGEPCRSCNKTYLVRRIAWRLQANAEGVSVLALLAGFSSGGAGPGGWARELALH